MEKKRLIELRLQAAKIRKLALEARRNADSGHLGGSYSIVEILMALYFEKMKIDPQNPKWENRDRFVLSKGHCTPAAYAALACRGYFPEEKFKKEFRQLAFHMSGHMEMNGVPGVDMSTGSLGQGISAAVGMAMFAKAFGKSFRTYCVVGDGEIEEGQVWEAAMTAGYYRLDNLVVIVDNNRLQLDGPLSEIMDPDPIDKKWEAFRFNVLQCDGHDISQICRALDLAEDCRDRPTAILAHTVKGKGVSIFENNNRFHGGDPTPEEYEQALRELDIQIEQLEACL